MRYILLQEGEIDVPYPNESYHLDDLITVVKRKLDVSSAPCDSDDSKCLTCRDAGKYSHCRFNFELNQIRIMCHKCRGQGVEMSLFSVYVTNPDRILKLGDMKGVCTDITKIVQGLELPRYMIGDMTWQLSSALADSLGSSDNLKVLEMKTEELTKANMDFLSKVVETSTVLEQLHLSGCWHEDSAFSAFGINSPVTRYKTLAKAIEASKSLKLLRISELEMESEQHPVDLFAGSAHKLEKFILSLTEVGNLTMQYIQQALEHPECQLQHVDISLLQNGTNISPVAGALKKNSSLKELVFSCNYNILDGDVAVLAQALGINSTLEKLELRYDKPPIIDFMLSPNGWKVFGQGLLEARGLRHIDLSWNHFTTEGIENLMEGLKKCDSLTHLTMQDILVSSEGFDLIGDLIKVNSFKFLDISRSNRAMTDHVLECVAHCLENNTGLEVLKLTNISFTGQNGIKPIFHALAKNTTLQELDVAGSEDNHLLRELTDALICNQHLLKLNLKSVPLTTSDFEYFAKSLPKMKGLESILFGKLHHTMAVALLNGMKDNDTLKHLDGPFGDESCWRMIDFYLRLNRSGRKSLKAPLGLLPRKLARSTNDPDVIFYFLREIQLHP